MEMKETDYNLRDSNVLKQYAFKNIFKGGIIMGKKITSGRLNV